MRLKLNGAILEQIAAMCSSMAPFSFSLTVIL